MRAFGPAHAIEGDDVRQLVTEDLIEQGPGMGQTSGERDSPLPDIRAPERSGQTRGDGDANRRRETSSRPDRAESCGASVE